MRLYGLRKFVSVILLLVLCPVLLLQLTASAGRSLVRDADLLKEIVQETGIYAELQADLVEQLAGSLDGGELDLTEAEMTTLANGVLPATRLQTMLESMIDGMHGWFWSDEPRPTIILDLTQMRAALPEAIRPIIAARIEALPVCSATRAAQLAASYQGGMAPCKSPDPAFNQRVIERVASDPQLQAMIPERLDLTSRLEQSEGPDYWVDARESFTSVRSALDLIPFGWGVIALLLALLALLNLDRWYVPFGWIGATLLIGGSLALVGGMLGTGLASLMMQGAIEQEGGGQVLGLIQAGADRWFSIVRQGGLLTMLLGVGSVIVAVVGKRKFVPAGESRPDVA